MLRWLYYRLHPGKEVEAPSVTTEESRLEAKTAVEKAEQDLLSTMKRGDLAYKLADNLKYEGEKNHLAELVEMTMRGTG